MVEQAYRMPAKLIIEHNLPAEPSAAAWAVPPLGLSLGERECGAENGEKKTPQLLSGLSFHVR